MSLIELIGVTKIYKMGQVEVPALRGLDLEVGEGEFVAIMGPSGSGKSTLMNIIGCLDIPTRGRVILDGEETTQLSEAELANLRGGRIGFVFQTFNLISTLTALENVELPMIFQGTPKVERIKRAKVVIDQVGLGARSRHRPPELSGGERQRVAIARALVNYPQIILTDEPTGNLDSESGEKILQILSSLNREENKTIILVSHDPEAVKYAKRKVRIKDGRIIDNGNHGDRNKIASPRQE